MADVRRWLRISSHVTIGGVHGTGVVSVRKDCLENLDLVARERVLEDVIHAGMVLAFEACKEHENYDVMDDELEFGGWPPERGEG